jgi:ParB family transcriptional regulator, chromosome partitioning protein
MSLKYANSFQNIMYSSTIELEDIASSIRRHGLSQLIIVRTKDHFEVIAVSRRYLACKSLGWKKIAFHVVELDDRQTFEVSLIKNFERKSLAHLEEGTVFKTYVSDNVWGSIADLASKAGRSTTYITKRIALLNLPDDVMENSSLKPSQPIVSINAAKSKMKDEKRTRYHS